jgi:hypothetical protein
MYKELLASGLSPKRLLKGKMGVRGLQHMMPRLKPLMIGRGVGQRRLSDEEIAYNVSKDGPIMEGGAARKKRTTPLKFRM